MKLPGSPKLAIERTWSNQQIQDLLELWKDIGRVLGVNDDNLNALLGSAVYTVANVTTDRSYDANATTVDEIADVLGTLIADLKSKNILS